jgi:hypothetical protein
MPGTRHIRAIDNGLVRSHCCAVNAVSAARRFSFGSPARSRWLYLKGALGCPLSERALELCDTSFFCIRITAAAKCPFTILMQLTLPTINLFAIDAVLAIGVHYTTVYVDLLQDLQVESLSKE